MLEDWGWQFAYELTNNTCTRDSIPTYLPSAPSCLHANIRSAPALNPGMSFLQIPMATEDVAAKWSEAASVPSFS